MERGIAGQVVRFFDISWRLYKELQHIVRKNDITRDVLCDKKCYKKIL